LKKIEIFENLREKRREGATIGIAAKSFYTVCAKKRIARSSSISSMLVEAVLAVVRTHDLGPELLLARFRSESRERRQ
jgi:hypothetical protein